MAEKKKHWIQDAIEPKNEGKFSTAAERAHKSTAAYAREKEHAPGKLGSRARLAETLLKLRKDKSQ